MKYLHLTLISLLLLTLPLSHGQVAWTLDSCVAYALDNNYTVKQTLLDLEAKKLQLQSSKMSRLPSLAASVNQNLDFGRAESAGGIILDNTQSSTTFGIGMNLPLFEGLRTYHQIASDKLNLQASTEDLNKTKEQIELSVTAYFLQVLLCKEILEIAEEQVALSQTQVNRIENLLEAGKSSEAEWYAAKATLASDEVSITEARNNLRLAKLDLAQLMNVANSHTFDLDDSDIDAAMETVMQHTVDMQKVIDNSLQKRPAIKAAELRIAKSEKDIKIAQAGYYPSLMLSANYGTGYYYAFQNSLQATNLPFGQQMGDHSREALALSLNIPIFDRLATSNQVKQSKLLMRSQQYQLEEVKLALVKEIEQAYTNAMVAKDKYLASQKAVEASEIAFGYEEKKYQAGTSNVYVYNEAKINYEKAQSQAVQAKYDFFFRLKILEFYNE